MRKALMMNSPSKNQFLQSHMSMKARGVKRPEQLLLTADVKYELPGPDLLRTGPAAKAKSKANDLVVCRTN